MAEAPSTTPNRPPLPEHLLTRLWERRAARQAWFRTSGGTRVRVVYPGRASKAAGPDFRNALLEVEGVGLVAGDVEIHVRQQDWGSHGHGGDPNYNGVVLHAALDLDASATELQSGLQVPVVSLAPLLYGDDPPTGFSAQGLWDLLAARGYARPESAEGMGQLLDRAGDQRFLLKSSQFQALLKEQDPEQTLYEGLMEGLGFHQNRQPFIKLASRAPYCKLMSAAQAVAPEERPQAIQAWLIRLSGLTVQQEAPLVPLPRVGFGRPMSAREWHCFRLRPSNHPAHRIAGAARLLDCFLEPGLVCGLASIAETAGPGKLTWALSVAKGPGPGTAYVGRARAMDLAVNVVLPFLHARAGWRREPGRCRTYLKLYHRYGRLQDNHVTREMSRQLLGPDCHGLQANARRQQGLLHLQRLLAGAC